MSTADIVLLFLLPAASGAGFVAAYTQQRMRRATAVTFTISIGLLAIIVTVVDTA